MADPKDRLRELLLRSEIGTLTEAESDELVMLMLEDRQALSAYLDDLHLQASISWLLSGVQESTNLFDQELLEDDTPRDERGDAAWGREVELDFIEQGDGLDLLPDAAVGQDMLGALQALGRGQETASPVDLTDRLRHETRAKRRAARRRSARRESVAMGTGGGGSRQRFIIPKLLLGGAAAAGLLFAASVLMRPEPVTPAGPAPAVAGRAVMATLVDQVGSRWEGSRAGMRVGDSLYGEQFTLREGTIELRMSSGATLIVQGPARFTLHDSSHFAVAYGRVTSIVPPSSPALTIDLPGVSFESQGAELGCVVSEQGASRADVFSGTARAVSGSLASGGLRLRAGQAVVSTAGVIERATAEQMGYVRDLSRLHYEDAVLADAPLSYWTMQGDPAAAVVDDAIPGGMPLFLRLDAMSQIPGPMGGAGIAFNGGSILDLAEDGEKVTARYNQSEAFTFEAWVRPDAMNEVGYLIVANTHDRVRSGWGVGVRPSGRGAHLTPFLTVGAQEWAFSGAHLSVGRWTHLVVTRDREGAACMYLDGRELGRHTGVDAPSNTPQYVHLAGRLTGERWRGGLAHVAYYDRRLSPGEIAQHARFGTDLHAAGRR